jgi:hypothetical protein
MTQRLIRVGLAVVMMTTTVSAHNTPGWTMSRGALEFCGQRVDSAVHEFIARLEPTITGGVTTTLPLAGASASEYTPAIERAVALLPKRPAHVLVIDVSDARPEDRDHLSKLHAFVLWEGPPIIYLTRHGDALREAMKGSRFHEHILATVIWHEMAHLWGADESEARRQEEALWTQFMATDSVDRDAALRHLGALKHRPPAGLR